MLPTSLPITRWYKDVIEGALCPYLTAAQVQPAALAPQVKSRSRFSSWRQLALTGRSRAMSGQCVEPAVACRAVGLAGTRLSGEVDFAVSYRGPSPGAVCRGSGRDVGLLVGYRGAARGVGAGAACIDNVHSDRVVAPGGVAVAAGDGEAAAG